MSGRTAGRGIFCGDKSIGEVFVLDGPDFPDDVWFGWIRTPEGDYMAHRAKTQDVVLTKLAVQSSLQLETRGTG